MRAESATLSALIFTRLCIAAIAALTIVAGCSGDELSPDQSGTLSGQVVVSGPLVGATVTVEQLKLDTGEIYGRVGDGDKITNERGEFSLETGNANGLFKITARGGSFLDLKTQRMVTLDGSSELASLTWFELHETRDDVLVGPIGQLIEARWRYQLEQMGTAEDAAKDAAESTAKLVNRHFADVDWMAIKPADLGATASSPTEPVRAALVQAALSVLAEQIAAAAQSSEQEVNAYTLSQQWAEDLRKDGVFDGNDRNDITFGAGIQLALGCEPAPATCERTGACPIGLCRPLCDEYVGTPRALLASAMSLVIQDPNLNRTTLAPADLLPIARALNDSFEPELFGRECIEQLDRLPPSLIFLAPSPADGGYAGGVVQVRVQGIDDFDTSPRTTILGYPDADGDPGNSIALAMIDTTGTNGPLEVEVESRDSTGNITRGKRTFIIDNIAPELALAPAGFIIDPDPNAPNDPEKATWWSADAVPTVSGTVSDAAPITIKAIVNGIDQPGAVTGTNFIIPLDNLNIAGTDVAIVATDAAGNTRSVTRRIRPDATPPAVSFQASTVNDEAAEVPTFAPSDESPSHSHSGAPVDLTVTGSCPVITKYSYLLGAATPEYVTEQPGRNPIAYHLVAADDGIGIAPNSTRVRVRRRVPGGPSIVVMDASAGTGGALPGGARLFDIAIVKETVAELSLREAIYDVDFETHDRFGRASAPTTRCFDLRLKAPPLHHRSGAHSAGHTFSLDTLGLVGQHDLIAERLLNNNATGASLLDEVFANSTTETVFLTITVTPPSSVTYTKEYVIRDSVVITSMPFPQGPLCFFATGDPDNPFEDTGNCEDPPAVPPGAPHAFSNSETLMLMQYPPNFFGAKLFEVNASGVPTTEIPCIAPCPPQGSAFRFAVPPRASGGAPARSFVAMTMIGQVAGLWPQDSTHPASPPFSETSVRSVRITGRNQHSGQGCTLRSGTTQANQRCTQRKDTIQYRALNAASLTTTGFTVTQYATAATSQLVPTASFPDLQRADGAPTAWTTHEQSLP